MKNIFILLCVILTPPSSLESTTEFLGFLENGQYCYFRDTTINPGSYYTDKRCREFVVRKADGGIIRIDTLWTEVRTTVSEQKDNSIISRKYKSNFNVFKFLADNKVSTQENHWSSVNLYDKLKKQYEMLPLKLWKGELYLHCDRISKKKDSILVYTKEENTKNIVAHLDNFLLEYEKTFTSINEKINTKTAIVNRCLADYKPQIKAVYYYNKAFLVQLEWNDEDDNQDVFDTYFTIPESVLEKSLEKLLKK